MKNENKKFPIVAVVLTFIALILAVACASTGIYLASYKTAGTTTLALFEIVVAVLFIAGLTASKNVILRVVSIIVTVSQVVISFIVSLVNLTGGTGGTVLSRSILFAISLLMLICSILTLIYFFMVKTGRIKAMYKFSGYTFSFLTFAYTVAYIIFDVLNYNHSNYADKELSVNIYFLTFALVFISLIPLVANKLLDDEEVKEEQAQ